ncbi:YncE family protein [Amycolatopsis sp. cg5]|uniref:YncE family protein n=1 Tax=Amycolatopsis sp. cg5 TaxID=3238802 RepID=UPI003525DEE8
MTLRRESPGGLVRLQLVGIGLAGALVLTGCSDDGKPSDDLQIVKDPVAATAPVSPATAAKPAGRVLPAAGVTAMAMDASTRTLVVALAEPPALRLVDLDTPDAAPRDVPLAGPVERLTVSGGQVVASIPSKSQLARVALPAGTLAPFEVAGQPAAGREAGNQLLVAVRDRKALDVFDGGKLTRSISGKIYSADDVITTGGSTVVLDRLRTAVFAVDVAAGTVSEGLRAGDGATNATADGFGRVLVTDTRDGALIAFSTNPLLMRQRYPVPGGIYGITYDTKRNLAWVTLTERNEVVGFDVRGGEPTEKYRFATVRQPNSVTVDEQTGQVAVGSATGEGIQVIAP